MERNYDAYNPEIVDQLIDVDNAIEKVEFELELLHERREEALNDPELLKRLDELIRGEEADLVRFKQEREDILRGWE